MSLLIGGKLVPVSGLKTLSPAESGGPPWARLEPGDYRQRTTSWIRQVICHTTGGNYPQLIRAGAGIFGHAQQIADMWSGADRDGGERVHSGAQLLIDYDGTVVCLVDLKYAAAYHAEACNDWSIGLEMCTRPDGSIHDATLDASARLVQALCGLLGIPEQFPKGPYRNAPLRRMETGSGTDRHQLGGPSLVGVFGHRDTTERRGRGDPGDEIWRRLAALGFEGIDYDGLEDLGLGRRRQLVLNALDAKVGNTFRPLKVDGIAGPTSMAAMRRIGFKRWRDIA